MSLRHALLAILTAEPMTGYDLVRYFDGTVAFVWNAPHSQIYPELRRMENDGLLEATVVPRGERAQKRVYRITAAGTRALREWALTLQPMQPERDAYRLKAAYFEFGSFETARQQLREYIHHFNDLIHQWERLLADIDAGRVPLLDRRLAQRPAEEHDAILAFKRFAFGGEVSRARAEVQWAEEGLALLDDLERRGAKLTGDTIGADDDSPRRRSPRR